MSGKLNFGGKAGEVKPVKSGAEVADQKVLAQAQLPWVEKQYDSIFFSIINPSSRPRNVDQVIHQDEVVKTLRKSIETGNVR